MIRFHSALFVLVLAVSGCELYSSGGDDHVVEGVSFTELFRPPSFSEIAAIEDEWSMRQPGVSNLLVREQHRISTSTLSIVSHDVGGITHFGGILAPDGFGNGTLPVIVYSHGGDSGVSIDDEVLLVVSFLGDIGRNVVVVIPSFRDETLRYQEKEWRSDGPPSPWNYDVDDALSLLSATPLVAPAADLSRVAVVGFSRGAGVGMLMGIRDPRIDVVIDFFGPTDFFGPFVQDVVGEALQGSLRNLPGLDYLNTAYIQPVRRGELTENDARPELIRRSPILFIDRIPSLQIHHGAMDTTVPVSQAEALIGAMQAAGRDGNGFESYIYPDGEHNPLTLVGSVDRAIEFLTPLLVD